MTSLKLEADPDRVTRSLVFSAPRNPSHPKEMSFKSNVTKVSEDCLLSCPGGMGLNTMPSVGRFKNDGLPSILIKCDVQCQVYNASSMAPKSNYGMFKDQYIQQNMEHRPTTLYTSSSNLYKIKKDT